MRVPHAWQVDSSFVDYRSVAWYRRTFDAPIEWQDSAARIEFEAVFHTATIWINEERAGEHVRKEYTFVLDITRLLSCGKSNTIAGRVDNAFNGNMLPRGRSSDWAHDAGIYRPVQRGSMRVPFAPFATHKLMVWRRSYSENGMRRQYCPRAA